MFENKVQKTVQKPEVSKPEVDKAVRDFEENQVCDVLLAFVSEDIAIPSIASVILTLLTKMGDRPAIWIGEFYLNEDKVVYLKLVLGQVDQELARLQKRQNKFERGDEIVDYIRIKSTISLNPLMKPNLIWTTYLSSRMHASAIKINCGRN